MQYFPNLTPGVWIEPCSWFIEKQNCRCVYQCYAQSKFLPLSPERLTTYDLFFSSSPTRSIISLLFSFPYRKSWQKAREFRKPQLIDEPCLLEVIADDFVKLVLVPFPVFSNYGNITLVRLLNPFDHFDKSGFTSTVWTKDCHKLPFWNIKADTLYCLNCFKGFPDFFNFYYVANGILIFMTVTKLIGNGS